MSRIDCTEGFYSLLHHTTNAINETPGLETVIETAERLLKVDTRRDKNIPSEVPHGNPCHAIVKLNVKVNGPADLRNFIYSYGGNSLVFFHCSIRILMTKKSTH